MDQPTIPTGLAEALRNARHVVALTGAGISAESGLPTFRDALTGLWARYRPEELSTPEAFLRDPRLVWEWHAELRRAMAAAQPNPAHAALAEVARRAPRLTLLTQNIDGLHQRAGSPDVVELHGAIARVRCFGQGHPAERWDEGGELPPRCAVCGSPLRPDVIWFGEALPEEALRAATAAARSCDLFLSVGTSGVVEPAASLAYRAMSSGAVVAIVNLDVADDSSRWLYKVNGRAGAVLPALVRAAWPEG